MSKKRAYKRKYHFIYKTTCRVTSKYYYGMHSTDDLEDGYVGSGKYLWYSINKHGKENHIIERLEFFDSREILKEKEKEIVNEQLINDPLCMNLQIGGGGGFVSLEAARKGGQNSMKNYWANKDNVKKHKESRSNMFKQLWKEKKFIHNDRTGSKQSDETKQKIGSKNSIHQKGSGNSQYGKCWITNGKESKKIYKGDLIPDGWRLGRKMNKRRGD